MRAARGRPDPPEYWSRLASDRAPPGTARPRATEPSGASGVAAQPRRRCLRRGQRGGSALNPITPPGAARTSGSRLADTGAPRRGGQRHHLPAPRRPARARLVSHGPRAGGRQPGDRRPELLSSGLARDRNHREVLPSPSIRNADTPDAALERRMALRHPPRLPSPPAASSPEGTEQGTGRVRQPSSSAGRDRRLADLGRRVAAGGMRRHARPAKVTWTSLDRRSRKPACQYANRRSTHAQRKRSSNPERWRGPCRRVRAPRASAPVSSGWAPMSLERPPPGARWPVGGIDQRSDRGMNPPGRCSGLMKISRQRAADQARSSITMACSTASPSGASSLSQQPEEFVVQPPVRRPRSSRPTRASSTCP